MAEKVIWEGTPSQWSNFVFYMLCIPLMVVFGLGLILALWKYLDTESNKIKITEHQITEQRGILAKVTDGLDLYQIQYIRHEQPFVLRFFELSTIVLYTSDQLYPRLILQGVEDGENIKKILRKAVNDQKDLKGEWLRDLYFN